MQKLPSIAAELKKLVKEKDQWAWSGNCNNVTFRVSDRHIVAAAFNGFLAISLGVEEWRNNSAITNEMANLYMRGMGAAEMTRMSFRTRSWFDVGMSHAEMCDSFFGSFLARRTQLEEAVPDISDLMLQLHGQTATDKSEVNLFPQTAEQARTTVRNFEGVDAFADQQMRSTPVTGMITAIRGPLLLVDSMVHLSDIPASNVHPFMGRCAASSLAIRDKVLSKLLSYEPG